VAHDNEEPEKAEQEQARGGEGSRHWRRELGIEQQSRTLEGIVEVRRGTRRQTLY